MKGPSVTVDGCALEVTWAKPPETQKTRSPADKRDTLANLYRHLNYDNLDHGFDFGLLQNAGSGFPMFTRGNARSKLPLPAFSNLKNPFTITRPIQLLNYICLENGWGEPEYHMSCIESEPSELFFVCWVLIPGFPSQHQKFMSDKVCKSPEEARYCAASYVLKKLNVTDVDGPVVSPPPSMNNSSSYTNFCKNMPSTNGSLGLTKTANISNLGFCSSPKTVPATKCLKSPMQMPYYFGERGQGDVGNFMSSSPAMDGCNFDDLDSATSSLLDPNTPIEPNSILGLIASMAAASTNNEMPIYNKPKL